MISSVEFSLPEKYSTPFWFTRIKWRYNSSAVRASSTESWISS